MFKELARRITTTKDIQLVFHNLLRKGTWECFHLLQYHSANQYDVFQYPIYKKFQYSYHLLTNGTVIILQLNIPMKIRNGAKQWFALLSMGMISSLKYAKPKPHLPACHNSVPGTSFTCIKEDT